MPLPSPYMSVTDLAAVLGSDVRLVRRAIARGDLPAATSRCPVSGRDRWDRAAMVEHFRALADLADAELEVSEALQAIAEDKNESTDVRRNAGRNLRLLMAGQLDVAGLLNDVRKNEVKS